MAIAMKSINFLKKKGSGFQQNSLLRFEFLSYLTRVSVSMYKIPKICTSFHKSLETLLKEHVLPKAKQDDEEKFRSRLYTFECNEILKENERVIKMLFDKNVKF